MDKHALKRSSQPTSTEQLIGLDALARRWGCSRATAARIVEASRLAVYYLTGVRKGIRRYKLGDIRTLEESRKS